MSVSLSSSGRRLVLLVTCFAGVASVCAGSDTASEATTPERVLDWRESKCCGPNSLYSVLKLRSIDVTLRQVHDLATPANAGVSLATLQEASRSLGSPMTAVKARHSDELSKFSFPIIAHLADSQEGHYLVVLGADPDRSRILVADLNGCDIQWLSKYKFHRDWSGFLLVASSDLHWRRLGLFIEFILCAGTVYLVLLAYRTWCQRNGVTG